MKPTARLIRTHIGPGECYTDTIVWCGGRVEATRQHWADGLMEVVEPSVLLETIRIWDSAWGAVPEGVKSRRKYEEEAE